MNDNVIENKSHGFLQKKRHWQILFFLKYKHAKENALAKLIISF